MSVTVEALRDKNRFTITEKGTTDLRNAIEHRATWFYLLLDEARKKGLSWDEFARAAIFRCGRFHGEHKFSPTDSLVQFAREFANEDVRKIFEMDVKESTEERFVVEFHYCPLLSAWLKQEVSAEDAAHLCDIAMDGDRGILDAFPAFAFDLQCTLAQGAEVCRVVVTRRSSTSSK
ncbi:L-2-amino-thiazoline-4-carboxylic acid hydrolase [Aminiphilus circumscriptus]|jgi:hypothetical protein|uniref:L-2-amino-thiazoline-4-carboxylic acid hydrolase n=1 Tax=Aminiphilus circumscriptus TaxID=290732 RepID=UPI0004786249|nr:L-2-amino-thiazoline-4-carboxylic acid hydrolase [Aminiphilus circumscriptus]